MAFEDTTRIKFGTTRTDENGEPVTTFEPAIQPDPKVTERFTRRTTRAIPEMQAAEMQRGRNDETLDVLAAGMADINPISAAIRYPGVDKTRYLEGYNPYTDPVDKKRIQAYDPDHFIDSYHPDTTSEMIRKLDMQRQDRELLARNPGTAFAGSAVGTIGNPILYAGGPMGAGARGVAMFAGKEMLLEGVSETLMHAQMPERSLAQSLFSVATVGTFSAGGGALVNFLAERGMKTQFTPAELEESAAVLSEAERLYRTGDTEAADDLIQKNMGAMEVARATLAEMDMQPGTANFLGKFSPVARTYENTKSSSMREFLQQFAPLSFQTKQTAAGQAAPVTAWSRAKQADADIAAMDKAFKQQFKAYRQAGGAMNERAFAEEVGRAMRQGDTHNIPQVSATAQVFRKIDDELFEKAAKMGLYGDEIRDMVEAGMRPNLKGAATHLQRIYRKEAARDPMVRRRLKEIIKPRIIEQIKNPVMRTIKIGDDTHVVGRDQVDEILTAHPEATLLEATHASAATLDKMADDVTESILRNMTGGVRTDIANPDYIVPKAGALHERTLGIVTDQELDDLGLLINDARDVMEVTSRQMRREFALQDTFGERDLVDIKAQVAREYDPQIAAAKDAKEIEKLELQRDRDLAMIDDMRNLLMGTYGVPKDAAGVITNANRWARMYNTVGLLVMPALTNLTDLAAPVLRQGLLPVAKAYKDMFSLGWAGSKDVVNAFGIAMEGMTGQRLSIMIEGAGEASAFQQKVYQQWGKWSGMSLITDIGQAAAGLAQIRQWSKMFNGFDSLKAKDISRLAEAGFDKDNIPTIRDQLNTHSKELKGGFIDPNTAAWTDREAAEIFENALRSEVLGRQVIEPIPGDVPMVFESGEFMEMGKMMGQFMRYLYSTTQRWTVMGMQRKDAEFLSGFLTMTALGGVVNATKDTIRGKDLTEQDAIEIVLNSLDRGAVLGLVGMLPPAIYAQATGQPSGRYFMKEPWQAFMGPGVDPAWKGIRSVGNLMTGDADEEDVWRAAKAIPFMNFYYALDLIRLMKEGYGYRD